GIGTFYNGVLHPVLVPAHLLLVVGLGLLLGQHAPRLSRYGWFAFVAAFGIGLAAGQMLGWSVPQAVLLALALIAGLLVALERACGAAIVAALATAAGVGIGLDSTPDGVQHREMWPALAGAAVGGVLLAPPRDRIVVTSGRIQQLADIFTKTWQRPPTLQELRGLIDAYVKEEVYYREALKLGLDRDDTLIRRRMQQKMEFLTEPGDDVLAATDAELEAYLAANRSDFHVEPRLAFQQIFINPEKSEQPAADRAAKVVSDARA